MKAESIIGLLMVILLTGLFFYIVEDVPPYGDPSSPALQLVRLDIRVDAAGVEEELNSGMIPAALVEALAARNFVAPSEIEEVTAGEWDAKIDKGEFYYEEDEKYYRFKKEGNQIEVYRYAPVVRYLEKGLEETDVPNIVTAVIVDYRAYDTLGETTVIFTAGISVILLLRRRGKL
ncbi:MAG: hypothetical protein JW945_02915 [Methanomicrobia archaeon]|nr:hypothetical protein [Methanomicrobia archaeon]